MSHGLAESWSPGRRARKLVGYLAVGLGLGALSGVLWWLVVDLPNYRVSSNGQATTTERGLADIIGGDAWFTAIGLVTGLALGTLGWILYRGLGWPVVVLTSLAAIAAALICWDVGYHLGPGDFAPRLAAAAPGTDVPVELTLRARASLLVWPFAATLPVLLGSSLGRDDDEVDPRPKVRKDSGTRGGPGWGRFLNRRRRQPARQ